MRKLILLLLLPCLCDAAPFLVSNPSPDAVDTCAWQEGATVNRSALVGGACHADLSAVALGSHSITVWFESSLWGLASPSTTFTFTRPVAGAAPAGIGINKN